MTDEPKKNHWYEMYELECLKTKELEAQIEKMKCCENCAFQLVIGGVRDSHCVKCNAYSEWELAD